MASHQSAPKARITVQQNNNYCDSAISEFEPPKSIISHFDHSNISNLRLQTSGGLQASIEGNSTAYWSPIKVRIYQWLQAIPVVETPGLIVDFELSENRTPRGRLNIPLEIDQNDSWFPLEENVFYESDPYTESTPSVRAERESAIEQQLRASRGESTSEQKLKEEELELLRKETQVFISLINQFGAGSRHIAEYLEARDYDWSVSGLEEDEEEDEVQQEEKDPQ